MVVGQEHTNNKRQLQRELPECSFPSNTIPTESSIIESFSRGNP